MKHGYIHEYKSMVFKGKRYKYKSMDIIKYIHEYGKDFSILERFMFHPINLKYYSTYLEDSYIIERNTILSSIFHSPISPSLFLYFTTIRIYHSTTLLNFARHEQISRNFAIISILQNFWNFGNFITIIDRNFSIRAL